ncbi:MAG: hypothetical protein IKW39_00630 [Alphaproteobacteria bacterium]|nr:hypothetical protein [Alphaproteobacteria bacterium]
MKHALLFVIAMMLFTGCDWRKAPNIVDFSKIELDSNNNFVCLINNELVKVDSVLLSDQTKRIYAPPYVGEDVTCFSFRFGNLEFYDGKATPDEIKEVYFIGDNLSSDLNFAVFTIAFVIFYAIYSAMKEKEEEREYEESIKSQQNSKD